MLASFKTGLSPDATKSLEDVLMENIEKAQAMNRLAAVQYANALFPRDHVPSRYVLLMACGDL